MNATYHNELIYEIPNFLSPEECREYIALAEEIGFEKATINTGRAHVLNEKVRNNLRVIWDDVTNARKLWQRLELNSPPDIGDSRPTGLNERFRFYKYFPGQQFRWHKDGRFTRNKQEFSQFTFMVYLNDDLTGGATAFKEFSVEPGVGKALLFQHNFAHQGNMVLSGIKYVLRTDVMYYRADD